MSITSIPRFQEFIQCQLSSRPDAVGSFSDFADQRVHIIFHDREGVRMIAPIEFSSTDGAVQIIGCLVFIDELDAEAYVLGKQEMSFGTTSLRVLAEQSTQRKPQFPIGFHFSNEVIVLSVEKVASMTSASRGSHAPGGGKVRIVDVQRDGDSTLSLFL